MKSSVGHGVKSATRRRRVCAQLVEELERRVLLAADVRFGVIGDFSSDLGTGPEQAVSNLVKSWSPQFVVTVGDNNYPNGGADTIDANIGQFYHQYIYPYTGTYGAGSSDSVNHFFPALGNHDWNTSGAAPYLSYFTLPGNERYYDLQQGNVGIFVVDSDPSEPDGNTSGSTQGKWLQSELAKSTAQWKFVFFHHPAYSSGGIGSNTWMQWPFAQWGATAVFQGHDHDYERLTENGIPYFVDGLGGETITGFASPITGSQVRYAGDYGAMLVDASSTSVTFTFTTRTGQLIDSYTIGSPTPPAAPSNLTASALSDSQVKLTWTDNSTNESGFKIERSPDGINFTQITTVAAGTTT
jgi:tartrate-resistant acid phosphatase type 5